MKITVLGAGSWGTALASVLTKNGHEVTLWARRKEQTDALRNTRVNEKYLPGVELPLGLSYSHDLQEALTGAKVVVTSVPAQTLRENLALAKPYFPKDAILVNTAKGLELGTLLRLSEVILQSGIVEEDKLAVLSGPSHAEELIRELPTSCVVSSASKKTAETVQDLFMNNYFRIYTHHDLIGVELGGALKNIIALGAGIVTGLGFGDNTKAALMTRGLAEVRRLGCALGAQDETFLGLSGVGDLIVTCTSAHSRNNRAGIAIGQGLGMQGALSGPMVVEGVSTALAARDLAKRCGVEMPITETICSVVEGKCPPREAVMNLMQRERRHETEEAYKLD